MKIRKITVRLARIGAAALCLFIMTAAFAGFGLSAAAWLPGVQFAPALMSCLAAFSLGAFLAVLGIALLTFCFGRFYCAFFCPLGILQDLIGFLSRRKGGARPNFRKTRYGIAGVVFGMLIAGWSGGLLFLDPYSNFGRLLRSCRQ